MRGTGWEITRRPDGSVLLELEQCAPVPGTRQVAQVTTRLSMAPQPFVDRMLSLVAEGREEAVHMAALGARAELDVGLVRPSALRRVCRWVAADPLLFWLDVCSLACGAVLLLSLWRLR